MWFESSISLRNATLCRRAGSREFLWAAGAKLWAFQAHFCGLQLPNYVNENGEGREVLRAVLQLGDKGTR
jgi:hypothetical protein